MPCTKPYLCSLKLNPDMTIDFEAYPISIPAVQELSQGSLSETRYEEPDITRLRAIS